MAVARRTFARGEVYLVGDRKTRPCLVVSPDELNRHLRTVIVAPMTTRGQVYPWRVPCRFQSRAGFVALDQVRTVDGERLGKKLGRLAPATIKEVHRVLQELVAA